MPLETLLRVAILAEIFLGVSSGLLDLALESRLPEPLRNYLAVQNESWSTIDSIIVFVGTPAIIAAIIGWIGLWRVWRPARAIYFARGLRDCC
jgi:ACR3 family arsenite efflux pump ArsB